MEFIGSLLQELFTLIGYVLVFAGVHKLYQVAADIREIKEAVNRVRSQSSFSPLSTSGKPLPTVGEVPDSDGSFDAANCYAENLLRAVQAPGEDARNRPAYSDPQS